MIKDKKSIYIKNIYYMLSYAYQNLQQKNFKNIETESFENVHDLFAAILSTGIATQIKQGLHREYIEHQDELSTIKGKVNMLDSMRLQMRNSNKIVCSYDELSENHYMNQILKTTARILISDNRVEKKNKEALKKVMIFFPNVDILDGSSIKWSSLRYHRNNASYRMLMAICYLVLKGLLLSTEKGITKLAQFLDEQANSRLYEKFILGYYQKHFSKYHPKSKQISWDTEEYVAYLPSMQSDIYLRDGDRKLIIDAKYYGKTMQRHHEKITFHSTNLYQIFAYVKNEGKQQLGIVDGMLLYAKTDEEQTPDSAFKIGGNQISVKTLDLNTPFEQLSKKLDEIVNNWVSKK